MDKLRIEPSTREDENDNITEIMLFYRASKEENLHFTYIDRYFIETYMTKLSQKSKMNIIENEYYDCESFIKFLKKTSKNNNIYLHTQAAKPGKSSFYNESVTETPNHGRGGGRGRGRGGAGGGGQRGGRANRLGCHIYGDAGHWKNQCPKNTGETRGGKSSVSRGGTTGGKFIAKCTICADRHRPYVCPLITLNKDNEGIKKILNDRKICVKCLFPHAEETGCRDVAKPYICNTHNVHMQVCKCAGTPTLSLNSTVTVNNTYVGNAGFMSEITTLEYGGLSIAAKLTYDSWCTHTTVD